MVRRPVPLLLLLFHAKKLFLPRLNGTHGRALFTITQAYASTRDQKYMDSAELAMRYLAALQPLAPTIKSPTALSARKSPRRLKAASWTVPKPPQDSS